MVEVLNPRIPSKVPKYRANQICVSRYLQLLLTSISCDEPHLGVAEDPH